MSDNPADSLRRELEAVENPELRKALAEGEDWRNLAYFDTCNAIVTVPLDVAVYAVEAARADEREKIEKRGPAPSPPSRGYFHPRYQTSVNGPVPLTYLPPKPAEGGV